MDGLSRAIGDGISGLVGGSVQAIGAALDGMVGSLRAALPSGALPVLAVAGAFVLLWLLFRR